MFNIENNLGNNTSFELTLSGPNGSPDLSGATTSIYVKPGSPTSLHRIKGQFPGDYILSVSEAEHQRVLNLLILQFKKI